ncbi:MAG: S16 family serine protease [Desulfurococcaceae archaeon]
MFERGKPRRVLATLILLVLTVPLISVYALFEYSEVKSATIYAPAVSSSGQGVLSKITLAVAYPGSGRVFFSALPYTEVETQGAARLAAYIASLVAKVEFSKYDYYVLVESTVPLIGGPSAGGLMTVGFTALLLNFTLNDAVTMTGMINPDGTIGPVGGLKEKLEAAANKGIRTFLIPAGQRVYSYPVYEEYRRGVFIIRRTRYVSVDLVEYGKGLGVDVVEVYSVGEALYYFTGLNTTTSIAVPQSTLDGVLSTAREFHAGLLNKITLLSGEATSLAGRLGGYYGYSYMQAISRLNQTIRELTGAVDRHPVYVTYQLLSAYRSALEYYWALRLLTGASTVENMLDEVNNTINKAVGEFYSENYTLESSLVQAYLHAAWLYYSNAMNTTELSSRLEYVSEALKLVELARLHYELSTWNCTPLSSSLDKLTEVYSHTLGVYTYTSRLLRELNAETSVLDQAAGYVEVLNYAYESKSPLVYGMGSLVLGYSSLAIHSALGTASIVPGKWAGLAGLYASREASPLVVYYLQLVVEAVTLGDSNTGILALTTAIALIQVRSTASTTTLCKSQEHEYSFSTNITTSTVKESAGESTGTSTVQQDKGVKLENIELALVLALAAIGAVTLAHVLTRTKTTPVTSRFTRIRR